MVGVVMLVFVDYYFNSVVHALLILSWLFDLLCMVVLLILLRCFCLLRSIVAYLLLWCF